MPAEVERTKGSHTDKAGFLERGDQSTCFVTLFNLVAFHTVPNAQLRRPPKQAIADREGRCTWSRQRCNSPKTRPSIRYFITPTENTVTHDGQGPLVLSRLAEIEAGHFILTPPNPSAPCTFQVLNCLSHPLPTYLHLAWLACSPPPDHVHPLTVGPFGL